MSRLLQFKANMVPALSGAYSLDGSFQKECSRNLLQHFWLSQQLRDITGCLWTVAKDINVLNWAQQSFVIIKWVYIPHAL